MQLGGSVSEQDAGQERNTATLKKYTGLYNIETNLSGGLCMRYAS